MNNTWQKSSFCESGQCVETMQWGNRVLVRDSKAPDHSPILSFDIPAWNRFLRAIYNTKGHIGTFGTASDGDVVLWKTFDGEAFFLAKTGCKDELEFSRDEFEVFIKGVLADEFLAVPA